MLRPTLLLKGAKHLTAEALVICDSPVAAEQGVRAVTSLLPIPLSHITLLPFALDDAALAGLAEFAKSAGQPGEADLRIMPPLSAANGHVLERMLARESLVVLTSGGAFLQDPANLEPLLTSRHPLLFLR
jgi:hypothetical protein